MRSCKCERDGSKFDDEAARLLPEDEGVMPPLSPEGGLWRLSGELCTVTMRGEVSAFPLEGVDIGTPRVSWS